MGKNNPFLNFEVPVFEHQKKLHFSEITPLKMLSYEAVKEFMESEKLTVSTQINHRKRSLTYPHLYAAEEKKIIEIISTFSQTLLQVMQIETKNEKLTLLLKKNSLVIGNFDFSTFKKIIFENQKNFLVIKKIFLILFKVKIEFLNDEYQIKWKKITPFYALGQILLIHQNLNKIMQLHSMKKFKILPILFLLFKAKKF